MTLVDPSPIEPVPITSSYTVAFDSRHSALLLVLVHRPKDQALMSSRPLLHVQSRVNAPSMYFSATSLLISLFFRLFILPRPIASSSSPLSKETLPARI